ncbi:MAG: hypothetical protein ACREX9_09350 [Gammaproteobacteria bacterium]
MSGLLSGLLAGGWPFLVGWVFPSVLSVAIFGAFIEANNQKESLLSLLQLDAASQAVAVILVAFGLALLLSAVQTQLYRLLEGYYFPTRLQVARQNHHQQLRDGLKKKRDTVAKNFKIATKDSGQALRLGLLSERLRRYPDDSSQIAPTRLGNAIRAFETYGWHHFRLDSQTLWYELTGVAPERTRADVERARAGVDFFIAMVYLSALGGAVSIIVGFLRSGPALGLIVVGVTALCLIPLWYELAVRSTDNWYQAMQALVNLGRKPLAESLNLVLPGTIEAEREMWQSVGWLIKERYNGQISTLLQPFSGAALTVSPTPDGEPPLSDQQLQQTLQR